MHAPPLLFFSFLCNSHLVPALTHTHRIVTRLHVSDPEEKAQEEGWEGRGERERERGAVASKPVPKGGGEERTLKSMTHVEPDP